MKHTKHTTPHAAIKVDQSAIVGSREYLAPRLLKSGAMHTIYAHLLGAQAQPPSENTVLSLSDGDFLEVFTHRPLTKADDARGVVVISHGLEGSACSSYVVELTHQLLSEQFTVVTWNMRGCGDRPNRLLSWYHSGFTADLTQIVQWVQTQPTLNQAPLFLIGFSVGGNITLKFLAEENTVSSTISAAACISVPVDLAGAAHVLADPKNRIFMKYLLAPLKKRVHLKALQFPGQIDTTELNSIHTFYEFDKRFTAPLNGFCSVEEYWQTQSSLYQLANISTPTLLLNALDDPFLSTTCYPVDPNVLGKNVYAEYTTNGGHVGFLVSPFKRQKWSTTRVISFIAPSRLCPTTQLNRYSHC